MKPLKDRIKNIKIIKAYRKNKWIKYSKRAMFSEKQTKYLEKNPKEIEKYIYNHINKNSFVDIEIEKKLDELINNSYLNVDDINKSDIKLDMLFWNFAYGFSFNEYLCYEFIKKNNIERQKFLSDRDSVEIGYKLNDINDIQIFNDKVNTYDKFKEFYKRDAVSLISEDDYLIFNDFIKKHKKFVKKEVDKACGESIQLIDINNIENNKLLFKDLIKNGKVILEELVQQNKATSIFNESSVNTVRCITLKINGEVFIPYCFMKIGRKGSFVDNGGAGGILVGIDEKTGILNTSGVDELGYRYIVHPDSKIRFKNYKLPKWDEMVGICKNMALKSEGVNLIGWDMAYTNDGKWIVIEGNSITEFIGPQSTSLKGIKMNLTSYIKRGYK